MQITTEEAVGYLIEYSGSSKIPIDSLLAAYLIVGNDLFFILDLFQKQTIKFPVTKTLKNKFAQRCTFVELSHRRYKTSRGWVPVESLVVGDTVSVGDNQYNVDKPIRYLLGHYYLVIGGN